MSGPVVLYGLRTTNLSRKPSGSDYLPAGCQADALSHARSTAAKSTLADANCKRSWRIYADIAAIMI
jgi:hypothetical protein